MDKKRHHYIPKAYLKSFCDETGKVLVYRKDEPSKPVHLLPDNTGFHKYYYSQPKPDGEKDHDVLENFFSTMEAKWPPLVERLHRQQDVNDALLDIIGFMILQYVRVPANRDVTENILSEYAMAQLRMMDAAGELPPKPVGFEDILDHVVAPIDPHQSIHAMVHRSKALGPIFDRIGFCAMHNKTDVPFLTSDNPVIWFDPTVQDADLRPYVLQPDGPIVFIFPVSPSLVIYGDTPSRDQFASEGLLLGELPERRLVDAINRQVCRFGYQTVFAQKPGQEQMIQEHAAFSPVVTFDRSVPGRVHYQMVFGKRERKPKWVD